MLRILQMLISRRTLTTAAAATVAGVIIGSQVLAPAAAKPAPEASPVPVTPVVLQRPDSFADLVEAVAPAVVSVQTSGTAGENVPMFRFPENSPFREFFEQFGPHAPGGNAVRPRHQAQGSGFVIDPDGYIVTNYHVVRGADEIVVRAQSGAELPATLRGYDVKTDLAVLKVQAEDPLPFVEFGDSDRVRVGDWVVAIGNPFALGGTATTGIISARGRDIGSGPFDDFLQIDAPINRGNSGGPLFNTEGRVIGVNTAIYSPNGGNVGIGFAIPSALARNIVEQLRDNGAVERGWLGVEIQTLDDELAESLGLETARGALVAGVMDDSPAQRAGIEPGDVILEFDGKPVDEMRDLPKLVAAAEPDSRVELGVWHDGHTRELAVKLARSEETVQVATLDASQSDQPSLGVRLATLTDENRARYRLADDTRGALVVDVVPGSPAARKGLRPGDIIKRVGSHTVTTPEDVVRQVKSTLGEDNDRLLLLVERDGSDRFVVVKIA